MDRWLRSAGVVGAAGPRAAECLAAELALRLTASHATGVDLGGLALDWAKCYDTMPLVLLRRVAERVGMPAALSEPMLAAYAQPRAVSLAGAVAEEDVPVCGLAPGCPRANAWLALVVHMYRVPLLASLMAGAAGGSEVAARSVLEPEPETEPRVGRAGTPPRSEGDVDRVSATELPAQPPRAQRQWGRPAEGHVCAGGHPRHRGAFLVPHLPGVRHQPRRGSVGAHDGRGQHGRGGDQRPAPVQDPVMDAHSPARRQGGKASL